MGDVFPFFSLHFPTSHVAGSLTVKRQILARKGRRSEGYRWIESSLRSSEMRVQLPLRYTKIYWQVV
jgi:hypothetical protein